MLDCMIFKMIDAVKLAADIVNLQITVTIVAPKERSAWNSNELGLWLRFSGISGLTIEGGGVIDGQGQDWWSKSCKVNKQHVRVSFNCSVSPRFFSPLCTCGLKKFGGLVKPYKSVSLIYTIYEHICTMLEIVITSW